MADEYQIKREAVINELRRVKEEIRRVAIRSNVKGIHSYVYLAAVEQIIKNSMDKYPERKDIHDNSELLTKGNCDETK